MNLSSRKQELCLDVMFLSSRPVFSKTKKMAYPSARNDSHWISLACEQTLLFGQARRARGRLVKAPRGFAARSRVLARLVSLAQIEELARRLGSLWHTFVTPEKQFLHSVDQKNFRKCSIHVSSIVWAIARKRDGNRGVLGRGCI